jgi:hypothetical protein
MFYKKVETPQNLRFMNEPFQNRVFLKNGVRKFSLMYPAIMDPWIRDALAPYAAQERECNRPGQIWLSEELVKEASISIINKLIDDTVNNHQTQMFEKIMHEIDLIAIRCVKAADDKDNLVDSPERRAHPGLQECFKAKDEVLTSVSTHQQEVQCSLDKVLEAISNADDKRALYYDRMKAALTDFKDASSALQNTGCAAPR